jgi:hypothetical protein
VGIATFRCLQATTTLQSRNDHSSFELGEDSHHLPDCGTNRIIRIVLLDFAVIACDYATPVLPNVREGCFLDRELSRKPIKSGDDEYMRLARLQVRKSFSQARAIYGIDRPRYALIAEDLDELEVARPAARPKVPLLRLQPVAVQLAAGAHARVPNRLCDHLPAL